MNRNPETFRGTVAAWQTDFFDHLNVRHYVGMFDEATWNFFAALGVTRDWFVGSGLGLFAVRHEIDYRRELHAGDVVVVTSCLLELGERKVRVEHRLCEAVTGEEAAVMELIAVCVDRRGGGSCPIPDAIRARAREMLGSGGPGQAAASESRSSEMREHERVGSDDAARSMRDPAVQLRRRGMLHAPHTAPLTEYATRLRQPGKNEVPDFDPFDGGIEALALFLFEKPGRMTAISGSGKRAGSGFISRNNDDPSAEATFNFMRTAGIPRELTITWNVIPWWNGTRKVTAAELREGVGCVKQLIGLLPKLRAVVLVGRKAARARPFLENTGLALFSSDHPSPIVRARFPKRWHAIPSDWARIRPVLDLPSGR